MSDSRIVSYGLREAYTNDDGVEFPEALMPLIVSRGALIVSLQDASIQNISDQTTDLYPWGMANYSFVSRWANGELSTNFDPRVQTDVNDNLPAQVINYGNIQRASITTAVNAIGVQTGLIGTSIPTYKSQRAMFVFTNTLVGTFSLVYSIQMSVVSQAGVQSWVEFGLQSAAITDTTSVILHLGDVPTVANSSLGCAMPAVIRAVATITGAGPVAGNINASMHISGG